MINDHKSACIPYTLRLATAADRSFVKNVYFESQRGVIAQTVDLCGDADDDEWFDSFYSEASTQIILVNNQDAGFLSVLHDPDRANIQCLFLRPEHQGRGIGTHLLQRIIEETASTGERLTIGTEKINPAKRLYERLGFVVVRETKYRVEFVYPSGVSPDESLR